MNDEIRINVPEGMEIDKENSTFECIKFKPKWIPKRGDIAAAGSDHYQIILVSKYIEQCNMVGFDVECLAVMSKSNKNFTLINNRESGTFWVSEEASASEKEVFINELDKLGYVYDPNDPRVIYKKEKELPKTWKEYCDTTKRKPEKEAWIDGDSKIRVVDRGDHNTKNLDDDRNILPSKEYAEAMLALCQLIQLRDCYNDGWKPDWKNGELKYNIQYFYNRIDKDTTYHFNRVLSFKTEELRETFLNNFRDLIEQAKPLL